MDSSMIRSVTSPLPRMRYRNGSRKRVSTVNSPSQEEEIYLSVPLLDPGVIKYISRHGSRPPPSFIFAYLFLHFIRVHGLWNVSVIKGDKFRAHFRNLSLVKAEERGGRRENFYIYNSCLESFTFFFLSLSKKRYPLGWAKVYKPEEFIPSEAHPGR